MHSPKKEKLEINFFPRMEVEELSFIFDNNGSLIPWYQRIQYDSVSEWEREAAQPQHHMAIEKFF